MSTQTRELTAEEWTKAEALLRDAPFAFVAMIDPSDGARPYVVPVNFAYEPPPRAPATRQGASAGRPGRVVFHTGPGRKSAALAANPRVTVAVTGGESYVQGATPCSDGYAFRSVLA